MSTQAKQGLASVVLLLPIYFILTNVPWERTHIWGHAGTKTLITTVTEFHPIWRTPTPADNVTEFDPNKSAEDRYRLLWPQMLLALGALGTFYAVVTILVTRKMRKPINPGVA
jgi:hypothetical protein